MKKTRRTALAAIRPLAAAIGLATAFGAAHAAGYPEQPITVVVPYSAGGGADNAARIIAQGMGEVAGQSVVIENKGGASGSIGAAFVARAKPDGYTVLYDASSFSINPVLRKLPYDAKKDFVPVSQAVSVPNILVAAPGSSFNNLQDFIDAARAKPGRLTFASYGPGSLAQMAAELLKKDANLDMVHVPYKGGAPAIVDVMGGQVDVYFANAASSLNYVTGGKLKALAVSSSQRMPELPNVATVGEAGIKNFNVVEWNGFFLPAGASPEVVAKLQDLVQKALARPETREKLAKLGLSPVGSSAEDFAKFVDAEQTRWAEVVKTNNIQVN
ncbi:tripartite tricarboxylate transporter substrate binding protein [Achromobacter sp. ACM05]|uniref:Bug family tripartite tricarboxylate transporter substrate binding protein n=1 Tax=Achromobacter sp. ACM05 TaxID=2854776 RepID=UPI001C474C38|nr:tripartite tricarboxylate transporter substrate binding protein [Achromobacter sp. ACM05]MBV7502462.1 tripartite tricarboxylate transporter substrate binding protein [Achromobacter sp. ACM05]